MKTMLRAFTVLAIISAVAGPPTEANELQREIIRLLLTEGVAAEGPQQKPDDARPPKDGETKAAVEDATATGPNEAQRLKAAGHLPNVPAAKCKTLQLAVAQSQRAKAIAEYGCGCPDLPDVELATSTPVQASEWLDMSIEESTMLVSMHARMLQATGKGSWKPGCHEDYPNHHAATYYVNRDSFPAHFHRQPTDADHQMTVEAGVWGVASVEEAKNRWGASTILDVALELATESLRRRGCIHIETSDASDHHVYIHARPIPGSTIGFAYFNNTQCSDTVELRIDSTWRPNLHNLCWLMAHELGHTNNLQHEFAGQSIHHGVMSYANVVPFQGFRGGDEPNSRLPRDPSVDVLERFYGIGAVPIKGGKDPDDPIAKDFPYAIGMEHVFIYDGRRVTTTVTSIDGDDGPTLGKRVAAALAEIRADTEADQARKERERTLLALLYKAASDAVGSGQSPDEAQRRLVQVRPLVVSDTQQWAAVFALADSAPTGAGFNQVWEGLTGNAAIGDFFLKFLPILVQLLSGEEFNLELLVKILQSLFL